MKKLNTNTPSEFSPQIKLQVKYYAIFSKKIRFNKFSEKDKMFTILIPKYIFSYWIHFYSIPFKGVYKFS
jgi:hypothetical protein